MKKLTTRKQFNEALRYISECRNYIYLAIFVFFASSLVGFFFAEKFTFFDEALKDIISKTQGFGILEMTFFIMQNNIQVALFAIILGVFFGIFPMLNAVGNGLVLGYVLEMTYGSAGFLEFWRLLPHGIFELPAIFISLGLGIKMGGFFFAKNRKKEFNRRFYESINVFLMVILPLLIIAGIIEGILIFFF